LSRFLHTHVRISLDMVRTRRREALLFDACIAMKQSLVVDNTNPTEVERAKYIEWSRARRCTVIGYHLESTLEELLARNAGRSGKARIPEVAIRRTFERLRAPSIAEGFDLLYLVHALGDGKFSVEPAGEK
jgi:predicted kinase